MVADKCHIHDYIHGLKLPFQNLKIEMFFFSWPIAAIAQGTGTQFDGTKMAAYFRNDGWKEDVFLKEEMSRYIKQGLQRHEILDFLKRDFAQYAWSIRTVDIRSFPRPSCSRLKQYHR